MKDFLFIVNIIVCVAIVGFGWYVTCIDGNEPAWVIMSAIVSSIYWGKMVQPELDKEVKNRKF